MIKLHKDYDFSFLKIYLVEYLLLIRERFLREIFKDIKERKRFLKILFLLDDYYILMDCQIYSKNKCKCLYKI